MDEQSASFGGSVMTMKSSHYPALDELISVTCAEIGLEPSEFEQKPKKRKWVTAMVAVMESGPDFAKVALFYQRPGTTFDRPTARKIKKDERSKDSETFD